MQASELISHLSPARRELAETLFRQGVITDELVLLKSILSGVVMTSDTEALQLSQSEQEVLEYVESQLDSETKRARLNAQRERLIEREREEYRQREQFVARIAEEPGYLLHLFERLGQALENPAHSEITVGTHLFLSIAGQADLDQEVPSNTVIEFMVAHLFKMAQLPYQQNEKLQTQSEAGQRALRRLLEAFRDPQFLSSFQAALPEFLIAPQHDEALIQIALTEFQLTQELAQREQALKALLR